MSVSRRRISEILQSDILSGKYPEGERLTQPKLANRFGVSQGVIRESLVELKSLGLVEVRENIGTFVRGFDANRMIEILAVREVLEGLAARLCCQSALPFELDKLADIAKRQYDLAQAGADKGSRESLDRKFHAMLATYSRNDTLIQSIVRHEILVKQVHVFRDDKAVYDGHLKIVEAIRSKDPELAESLMRAHVRTNVESIMLGHYELRSGETDVVTDI
ncbi:MAG: GntR family transcriptional regulator [Phycisphaerae bacterium]|nr:GntR family transcriptional regulator [Phycisphaerae bacterium]